MVKYQLSNETIKIGDITLYRIIACVDFGCVKVGEKGGFVEKENNLSQIGNAWVCDNAKVYGNAEVCDNAKVYGNAEVCGDAKVYGNAEVYGDAKVCGDADYIVFKNFWSSGRYLTWTRSNDKWRVGCFYGSGAELVAKAYKDSEISGRNYQHLVDYVKLIKTENNEKIG